MMKKLIWVLAALVLVGVLMCGAASAASSGTCGDDLTWSLNDNGVLTITGNGPMTDYVNDSVVPWSTDRAKIRSIIFDGAITSIGDHAFYYCTGLTTVSIPNSVTKLGWRAFFQCSNLTSVILPNSVDTFGEDVFYGCRKLADENGYVIVNDVLFEYYGSSNSISIPDGIKHIEKRVFEHLGISGTLIIPDSVVTIGDYAFAYCNNLTGLQLGSGIRSIGKGAFYSDTNMFNGISTITIPVGTSVCDGANASFPESVAPVNAIYNGIYYRVVDHVFMGHGYGDLEYIDGPMMAVVGCQPDVASISIRSAVLGMPVRAIADYAFTGGTHRGYAYGASKVTSGSLIIPDSVEYIGYNACYELSGITSIKLGSNVKVIGAHAFNRMNYTSTAQSPLVIPASVQFVGNYAFHSPNAESITINGGSLVTASNAFQGIGVKSLSLNGDMQLAKGTFSFCRSLTNVNISANAEIHGLDIAFETGVVDPSYEPNWLFTSFSVTGSGSNYSVVDGVLFNGDQTQLIRCPLGKPGTFVIPNTVTSICDGAFAKCTKLRSVLFTNNSVNIADDAFSGCNLTVGGENGTAVQEYALSHNLSFTIYSGTACGDDLTWSLDGQILTISGTGAMTNYTADIPAPWGTGITAVVLDPRITSLGSYCFTNCSALSSISIPEGATSIGSYVFAGCSGLTQLVLPDQIANIGSNTFGNSLVYAVPYSTTAVTLSKSNYLFRAPDTEYNVKHTFNGEEVSGLMLCGIPNKSITEFTIPMSITAIGQSAFSSCSGLSTIDIPMSVTSIGSSAFSGCTELSAIDIPASVTSIGSSAFSGCTGLMTINLQHCNAALSDGIFSGCSNTVTILLSGATVNVSGSSRWGVCGNHAIYTLNNGTLSVYGEGPMSNYSLSSYTTGDKYDGYTTVYYPNTPWRSLTVNCLEVHAGITSVGAHALHDKTGLTSVSLPNSLTIISDSAFEGCTALPSIVIPAHVTAIGSNAFFGCRSIRSIRMEGNAPSISSNAFTSVIANVYYCPNDSWTESVQNYGGTLTWIKSNGDCGDNTSWILDNIALLRLRGSGTVSEATWTQYANSVTTLVIASDVGGINGNLLSTLPNLTQVIFEGEVPTLAADAFTGVAATAYYSHSKQSWTAEARQNYGGSLNWQAYCTHSGAAIAAYEAVHNEELAPADCVTNGHVEHWTCSGCNLAFADESLTQLMPDEDLIIPAPGHTLIAIEGFPATCTEAGLSDEIFCEVCGETIQVQEEIPALGHHDVITIEALAPTCTEDGHTEQHVCDVCNEVLVASEVIPATGHTYTLPAFVWSEDGKTCTFTFVCEHEDDTQVLEISAVGTVAEAPACEAMGTTLYTATAKLNEQTYTETTTRVDIEATGHNPVEDPAVAPTDRETGLTAGSHCEACGTVLVAQETIPALWSYSEDGLTATAYNGTGTALTIPDGVTALSNTLFKGNTTVTSVVIPDSVTTIGTQTFFGAAALTDVWLPDNLDGIGTQTFYNITAVLHASMDSQTARALSLRNKAFTDGEWTLRYRVTSLTAAPSAVYLAGWNGEDASLVLPESFGGAPLTQIMTGAFDGQTQLQTVTIPDSVTSIAPDAFSNCAEDLVIRSSWNAYVRTWASSNGIAWAHAQHTPEVIPAVAATCTEDGLTEGSVCSECGEVITAQEVVPALGHEWGEVTYTWSDDNTEVTALRACTRDPEHVETETVPTTHEITKQSTCEDMGETTYTSGEFQNAAFTIQSKTLTDVPAIGHAWGEPTYTWNEENTEVTATHVCATNAEHVETETVPVTAEVTKQPTCEDMGETTYASGEFQNAAFAVQSKTITDVPALGHVWGEPDYTWSEDNTEVTGRLVCSHDSSHEQSETVTATLVIAASPTQTTEGELKYVSAAFENVAFAAQEKTGGTIPALGTLTMPTFPASLTTIEDEAFEGTSFQAIVIPDTVTAIGSRAFANCRNLVYVYIPASVTSIAPDAFADCPNVIIERASE